MQRKGNAQIKACGAYVWRALLSWLLLLVVLLSSCSNRKNESFLEIYCLDVGQGDATLLRTAEGDFLIDAGPENAQEYLCARLHELGVKQLRLAVFTHPDEDHIGGADLLLSQFSVEEVWFNGGVGENDASARLHRAANESGAEIRTVRAGMQVSYGALLLLTLAPVSLVSSDANDSSIVVKLTYGAFDALFTGDLSAEMEMRLLEVYADAHLSCELYHVGHHGSYTSTTQSFLNAVSPECAVISCGVGNPYGHPHGEVLARLEQTCRMVMRTDLMGEIVIRTDGARHEYGQ